MGSSQSSEKIRRLTEETRRHREHERKQRKPVTEGGPGLLIHHYPDGWSYWYSVDTHSITSMYGTSEVIDLDSTVYDKRLNRARRAVKEMIARSSTAHPPNTT